MSTTGVATRSFDLAAELLRGEPGDVALASDRGVLTYAELQVAVDAEADRLGSVRRVVLLEMRNDITSVVRLLGAFAAGHPVVLLGVDDAARHDEIAERYAAASDLHPDLALLLSTSGSTGSPKLVRLSRANLVANAASIATYLELSADDRGITSLPLHYCYGLSVLTSHLLSGAGVVLTDLSVADDCFWELAHAHDVTGVAGVPYTFDLLDNSGFAERDLPALRYLTQAGGRMEHDQVVRYADLGRSRGWDLFVMYGQTEATARMSYLPPELAAERPTAIGLPVPGGSFRLAPAEGVDEPGVGELVYAGANVMMGYATDAADIARGPELAELRTGDLARQADDGLWEICGRLDRNAKVFGLRLDLARLEAAMPVATALVAVGDALHAFVTRPRQRDGVRAELVRATGLPSGAVRTHLIDAIPKTARGKTDHPALCRHARASLSVGRTDSPRSGADPDSLRDLYATVLRRPDATTADSFVALGGDSLSFVEVSTQLSRRLGHLPSGWQRRSPAELATTAKVVGRRRWTQVEPSALLRALAIVMIVASHADLLVVMGGAHVLLGVAGSNLARFSLAVPDRVARVRRVLATTAAFAVPASLWMLLVGGLSGDYDVPSALYLHQLGSHRWSDDWQFWFLDVLVWTNLVVAALLLVPALDRAQRRRPFATALAAAVVALGVRYVLTGVAADGLQKYTVPFVVWCFAIGWAAAEARTWRQRGVVAALALLGPAGFFPGDVDRQLVVVAGLLVLLLPWSMPLPRLVAVVVQHVATASFWIYVTHWQVYPPLEASGHRLLAVLASLAVGLAAHRLWTRGSGWVRLSLSPHPAR
jgi:acyl-CoA synthetase (AMP-forming)/AMP-acid ligase II/peptidoglycan/LPS O-acetylase OafA/YrhL